MVAKNRIIIDAQQLAKAPREVTGELDASIFDLSPEDRFTCTSPLVYHLRGSLVGEGFLIEGTAGSTIHCNCDRCLNDYDCDVTASSVCHFYEGLEHQLIDITDDIREDVVISFPDRCLCNKNCKGLCPECGQNLNEKDCDCTGSTDTPNVWDQLDGLDL